MSGPFVCVVRLCYEHLCVDVVLSIASGVPNEKSFLFYLYINTLPCTSHNIETK